MDLYRECGSYALSISLCAISLAMAQPSHNSEIYNIVVPCAVGELCEPLKP